MNKNTVPHLKEFIYNLAAKSIHKGAKKIIAIQKIYNNPPQLYKASTILCEINCQMNDTDTKSVGAEWLEKPPGKIKMYLGQY